jgi:hypothetical protein
MVSLETENTHTDLLFKNTGWKRILIKWLTLEA